MSGSLKSKEIQDFCIHGKVMYVIRGLPGSGKSTLARSLAKVHQKDRVVICSADEFRYNEHGEYVWNASDLERTHEMCCKKARTELEKGTNIVIIDNTNVEKSRMDPYFEMAHNFNYIVILIEPETPWKNDLSELAKRNEHNVSYETLHIMKENFQLIIPYYFGWFLPCDDSANIKRQAEMAVKHCFRVSTFCESLSHDEDNILNVQDFLSKYTMENFSSGDKMLHITACFTSEGKMPWSYKYALSERVEAEMGNVSDINIIGWFITPRTFGARLRLSPRQQWLWGKNDRRVSRSSEKFDLAYELIGERSKQPDKEDVVDNFNELALSDSLKTLEKDTCNAAPKTFTAQAIGDFSYGLGRSFIKPSFDIGSTAHITTGCRGEFRPVQAGNDLYDLITCELSQTSVSEHIIVKSLLRHYGEGRWVMYLKEPIVVPGIFSGCYL